MRFTMRYNPRQIGMETDPRPGSDIDATLTAGIAWAGPGVGLSRWRQLEIREAVGSGAFGNVYRAWDTVLEREVALKLLRVPDPSAVIAEGRALARVRHPNVATVYGVDTDVGVVGLWTEFIKGRTLADQLRSDGPMSAREAALVVQDVCRALAAVHGAGLLHRDVKVHNVMREEGGRIVLMDFGLSQFFETEQRAPEISGTPPYMAPELLRGEAATPRSDLYAAGVMLYHLVSGRYPVEGKSLQEVAMLLRDGQAVQLRDRRPELPEAFLRVVEKATARDEASRYATAGEMAKALAAAVGDSEPSHPRAQPVRPRLGRPIVIGTAAVLLAGAVLIGVRQWTQAPASFGGASAQSYGFYRKGRELLERHDRARNIDAAIQAFQTTIAADPRFALAYAGLGDAYWEKYRATSDRHWLDLAEQNSRRALELNDGIGSVYATIGRIHADAGQTDVALQDFQRGLALDPRGIELHRGLAQCYEANGRMDEAEAELKKAAALKPDYWYGYNRLGGFYYRRGRYEEAVRQYRRVVEVTPDNVHGWNNLGTTFMALGRWADARVALERALAVEPSYSTLSNLGSVALLEGRYAEGAGYFEEAKRRNDADYMVWANAASAYAWSGNKAEARVNYAEAAKRAGEARKLKPSDPKTLSDLAMFNAMLGKSDESLGLLDQVIALVPENPDVLYRVAETYEFLGRRDPALEWIRRALDRGYSIAYLKANPELRSLLADRRFRNIEK